MGNHWRTPPLWTEGSFCACTNSHNNLYCEYVTGMITYSDLNQDPFQLRNMLYTLSDSEISFMHRQLKELKEFKGQDYEVLPSRSKDDHVKSRKQRKHARRN